MAKKKIQVIGGIEEIQMVEKKMPKKAAKVKLKTSHFQHPDDLCDFVNQNDITVEAIVAFDRFQALYYTINS